MISCNTFTDRLFGCSHFKQENNYAKTLSLFIHSVIVRYKDSNDVGLTDNFFNILVNQYTKRSFAGSRLIYKEDKETFEDLCITCAENLTAFFHDYTPTKILDHYVYRSRINGDIGCQIELERVTYNVDFSVLDSKDTFYRLYYHRYNNYLYNVVNGSDHAMVIFMIPNGNYYLIPYRVSDYTTGRGMLSQTIKRRTHRPGHQCLTCSVTECKPRLINNLRRV